MKIRHDSFRGQHTAPNMTAHNLQRILVSQLARQKVENSLGWWAIAVAESIAELVKDAVPFGGALTNEAWLLERAPMPMGASSW